MKTLTLNIGLNTNDGGRVPLHLAFVALSNRFEVIDSRVDTSGAEETIVCLVYVDKDYVAKLHELCAILKQDCIAISNGENGVLIGPNAAKWGQFNAEFFVPFELPAKPVETNLIDGYSVQGFCEYLSETIIPDSKISGFEGYAQDLETALKFILKLS